jgi:hypothetical protein
MKKSLGKGVIYLALVSQLVKLYLWKSPMWYPVNDTEFDLLLVYFIF